MGFESPMKFTDSVIIFNKSARSKRKTAGEEVKLGLKFEFRWGMRIRIWKWVLWSSVTSKVRIWSQILKRSIRTGSTSELSHVKVGGLVPSLLTFHEPSSSAGKLTIEGRQYKMKKKWVSWKEVPSCMASNRTTYIMNHHPHPGQTLMFKGVFVFLQWLTYFGATSYYSNKAHTQF